jgi:hypothetical protein
VIDASERPTGITIAWIGGTQDRARVLADHGDLTLREVFRHGRGLALMPSRADFKEAVIEIQMQRAASSEKAVAA